MPIQPRIDLYGLAASAAWTNGSDQPLPFKGSELDKRGSVIPYDLQRMVDGKVYFKVLKTRPEWKSGGGIRGRYRLFIPADATLFRAYLGFFRGAKLSNGILFTVLLSKPGKTICILNRKVANDEVVQGIAPIPEEFRGKPAVLSLEVHAGLLSNQGWAAWIAPHLLLERAGPGASPSAPPPVLRHGEGRREVER